MNLPHQHTLTGLLDGAARRRPHGVALICGRERRTFLTLQRNAQSLAQGLARIGVGPGDRVAIWLPNIPLWCETLFACAQLGAIAIGVNARFRSAELGDVLGRSAARVLVLSPRFHRIDFIDILQNVERQALAALTTIVMHDEEGEAPAAIGGTPVLSASRLLQCAPHAGVHAHPDAGCIMFTSSGTTSKPKFVLHSQRSIVQHACDTARAFGYDEPDSTVMAVTPFSGVSGFGLPVAALAAGAPLVFSPAFDEESSLADIREHRVTHTHANHEILRRWLAAARGPEDFGVLKLVNCGSGIAGVAPRAQAVGVPLLSIYGSSELQARFSRQRPDIAPERALEAGGFPVSTAARLRTSDPETGRLLQTGEKGELEALAPSAMMAYFGDAAATSRAITAEGYVRTGDFGWTRADGSFVLEGRMGDVLKLSGFMTSPAEIEAMIASHPGVAGCQVVGVATERGTRAAAFVVPADGAPFDEAELIAYCAQHMARYKVPLRIYAIDEFPLTAGANAPKVRKTELRKIAEARLGESRIREKS